MTDDLDYFAVYSGRKGTHSALCTALARDAVHAKKIARSQGLTLTPQAWSSRIGREGYAAALRSAFNARGAR